MRGDLLPPEARMINWSAAFRLRLRPPRGPQEGSRLKPALKDVVEGHNLSGPCRDRR